jgi:hypothetical protein
MTQKRRRDVGEMVHRSSDSAAKKQEVEGTSEGVVPAINVVDECHIIEVHEPAGSVRPSPNRDVSTFE